MSDIIDEILKITPVRQGSAVSSVGFGAALIVDGDSDLDGEDYVPFSTAQAVDDAVTATNLSAVAGDYVKAMLAAKRVSTPIYVGKYLDASEDPSDGYAAAQAAMLANDLPAPYWLGTTSRDAADILAAVAWLAADSYPHIGIFQQADADSLTTGYPAAFSTIQAGDRKVLIYAAAAGAKYLDADCIASQSGVSPAIVATGGHWEMGGQVGDALTDTERDFARGHAIATGRKLRGAPAGNKPVREYELRTVGGANPVPLYLMVTIDYVVDRIRTAVASTVARTISLGDRFPGGVEGEGLITGLVATQCGAVTGTGTGAWLSPTDAFDGRSWDLSLTWDSETRKFSGLLRVNVRSQIAEIDLTAVFGEFINQETT